MSGERGLVDTNVVVDLPRLLPAALPDELVISAVTMAELSAGPHHARDPSERARRIALLQHAEATFDPLPFDVECARAYGLVSSAVLAAGGRPRSRFADLQIAATAMANDLPLYTVNVDDFIGLGDLVRVVPVDRARL